jgi:endonuclease/exonuclease/phosphatase (EEP) superfamily protein YafD
MRVRRAADLIARLLLAGIVSATAAGLAAPYFVVADLANDFRPVLIATAIVAAVVTRRASSVWIARAASFALIVNLWLAAVPLLQKAPARANAAGQLRVVSFNVWTRNTELERSRDWLARSDADVIVLQEFNDNARREIVAPLQRLYPHVHDCRCNDIAILSRHPFTSAGGQARTANDPAMSWMTLTLAERRPLKLVGVHTTYPKKPDQHAAHFTALNASELLDHRVGPIALVGDFNATPWSWRFHRFLILRGLKRHGGISASWPSTPLPLLLLDNVVTTPDISRVAFEIGPHIGSDHRPVTATIALP